MGFQVVEIDGASFTADGRLKVAQEPPTPPPATTPVEMTRLVPSGSGAPRTRRSRGSSAARRSTMAAVSSVEQSSTTSSSSGW